MTIQHADEMLDFNEWACNQGFDSEWGAGNVARQTWQAATASADAKYLPVIEKLAAKLELAITYADDGAGASARRCVEEALHLAAPLLWRE